MSSGNGGKGGGGAGLGYGLYFSGIINYLNTVPDALYIRSKTAADTIAKKVDEYASLMSGEEDPSKADTDNATIATSHFNYLNHLRTNQPLKYRALQTLAEDMQGKSAMEQNMAIRKHFLPVTYGRQGRR